MNRYIILLLLIFNISCEKTIDINLPSQESKLVVNGSLISNKNFDGYSQYIYISNSIEGLGNITDYEFTDSVPVINYASVDVLEIENENDIIEEYQFEFDNDCYCYSNNNFIPKESSTYQLKVSADDFPDITALETMPSETDFNISNFIMGNILDRRIEGKLCEFDITINDEPGVKNFYKLKVFVVNTFNEDGSACVYTVDDPSFLIPINKTVSNGSYFKSKNGYFTDELFDGETKTFSISVDKPTGRFEYFYIQLTSLSKNNYMFNITRKEQNRDSNNFMFNNEPMFIQSNINGGYGIFGGESVTKKAYIPTFYPTNGWLDYWTLIIFFTTPLS